MTSRLQITLLRAELAVVAATFLLFSLLHFGVSIGLLSDVHIRAGGIAEAILGVFTLVAFVATLPVQLRHGPGAWWPMVSPPRA